VLLFSYRHESGRKQASTISLTITEPILTNVKASKKKNIENREKYKINPFIFNSEVHHVLRKLKNNASLENQFNV